MPAIQNNPMIAFALLILSCRGNHADPDTKTFPLHNPLHLGPPTESFVISVSRSQSRPQFLGASAASNHSCSVCFACWRGRQRRHFHAVPHSLPQDGTRTFALPSTSTLRCSKTFVVPLADLPWPIKRRYRPNGTRGSRHTLSEIYQRRYPNLPTRETFKSAIVPQRSTLLVASLYRKLPSRSQSTPSK